jgi:hypothetical protein
MDITETKHDYYSVFKLNGRLDSNTAMGLNRSFSSVWKTAPSG